ncbi:MAG: glycoside hydrolase family 97 C-terminal domain-containing protein [Kiritimatiellae bacterium]|nr:glycoside hydrolase family 97 C-terminal domain-containing protein [Kiritimatiellia bacterium]
MLTLRSPDGRLRADFALRAGGRFAERGAPAVRVVLDGRVLLGWSSWLDDAAQAYTLRRHELRVLLGARRTVLARELSLDLRSASRPARPACIVLRCADGGALLSAEPTGARDRAPDGWTFRFPRGSQAIVADPRTDSFMVRPLRGITAVENPPWTCLYPHGKCAALLRMAGHADGGWMLLAGDRPCDLPAGPAARWLLWGREREEPPPPIRAAQTAVPPATQARQDRQARAEAAARFNCHLPFTRARAWPGAAEWEQRWSAPRLADVTPAHARAALCVTGADGVDASDETLFVRGEIGAYVLAARRRGAAWELGAITVRGRVLTLDLSFLAPDVHYRAVLVRDDPAAPDGFAEERLTLDASSKPVVTMGVAGGFVLRLEPAAEAPA